MSGPAQQYRTADLFRFIKERHAIYKKRQQGKPKPWTKDPILQRYRFCNVYRELDTVTQWIASNWRTPNASDPYLWFAMCVARLVNWPETMDVLGYPVPWNANNFERTLEALQGMGAKAWGGAYIVSTNGNKMVKHVYIAECVLQPLWSARGIISSIIRAPKVHLAGVHHELQQHIGLGSFLAAQVIADLKYVTPLNKAADWSTWAASGPGSRRGLNRVMGLPTSAPMPESTWLAHLQALHYHTDKLVLKCGMPAMHAQDLQNCLCEFDKYERTRLGEGRPRSTYHGL